MKKHKSVYKKENAEIGVVTEDGENTSYFTDENGKASIVLPVGEVEFTAGASGMKTRKLKYTITHAETEMPLIGLSSSEFVSSTITAREMSYDEIIDAGIDIDNPENKHIVEYTIVFEYVVDGEKRKKK